MCVLRQGLTGPQAPVRLAAMAKQTKLGKPPAIDSAGAGLKEGIIPPEPAVPDGKTAAAPKKAPKGYRANIFPNGEELLPVSLGKRVAELEAELGMPVWLLIQDDRSGMIGVISRELLEAFVRVRADLPDDKPVALLIHSLGGDPSAAYQLAKTLRRRCGSFVAIVPRRAKSAATLLSLGAKSIALGAAGELGPLVTPKSMIVRATSGCPRSMRWKP